MEQSHSRKVSYRNWGIKILLIGSDIKRMLVELLAKPDVLKADVVEPSLNLIEATPEPERVDIQDNQSWGQFS